MMPNRTRIEWHSLWHDVMERHGLPFYASDDGYQFEMQLYWFANRIRQEAIRETKKGLAESGKLRVDILRDAAASGKEPRVSAEEWAALDAAKAQLGKSEALCKRLYEKYGKDDASGEGE